MHLIPDRQTASRCAALARGAVLALGAAMLLGSESTAGTDGPAPRSAGEVKAMMQLLASPGDASPQDRFLARMRQYRYLCGVPYEGLAYNPAQGELAQAAAAINARLNKLTHAPERPPGMSDADYQLGRTGAAQCNLFSGRTDPSGCVDGWMDDSDDSNIDRVGHRRWILNPAMGTSAFGTTGNYAAMYAFDGSNKQVPDWDLVAYPPAGPMPVQCFGARHAWSISLNTGKYAVPSKDAVTVTVQPLASKGAAALTLDYFTINGSGFGSGPAIIFRPKELGLQHDNAFTVTVAGLKGKDGAARPLSYTVRFIDVERVPAGAEGSAVYTRVYQQRLDSILAVTDDIGQMELLHDLLSDSHLSDADPGVRKGAAKRLGDLVKDQDLKREYVAIEKYKRCVAQEKRSATTRELVEVATTYRDLAKAYRKTRVADRALDDFNRLKTKLEAGEAAKP